MTMVNAWVERNRALVAVDSWQTKNRWHEGEKGGTENNFGADKAYLQPIKRLLITNRGTSNFVRLFFNVCEIADVDFDQIVCRFPELLDATLGMMNYEISEGKRDPTEDYAQELWVIGWSKEHKCFRGTIRYRRHGCGEEFETSDFPDGGYGNASPYNPDWGPCPVTNFSSHTRMIELARWQMKMDQKRPKADHHIGGRLKIIEMTPFKFSIRTDIVLSEAPGN